MNDEVSKSWFCVLNNPSKYGFEGEPNDICEQIADAWVDDSNPYRTCAVAYCISADGLHHCHCVFEDLKAMRFSFIKKVFPSMHIEPTKGTKEQAENYINKLGKYAEKGESILYIARRGQIKGAQGARRDLDIIEDLLKKGMTPEDIFDYSFSFRKYETMIRKAFFDRLCKLLPPKRFVNVIWHCGPPGSGKTHTYQEYCEKFGEENCYLLTDYSKGGLDLYIGQKYLFMGEFRGAIPFGTLLNYLDGYKVQIPARYANSYECWDEVHICTVLSPEEVYHNMVNSNPKSDSIEQLKRRISRIVYHWKDDNGYQSFDMPMLDYVSFDDLKNLAMNTSNLPDEFI